MQLGIISDIHDHLWNLDAALLALEDCDALLCAGDLCAPFVMAALGRGFAKDIHIVFGNNDADLFRITRIAQQIGPRVHLHGELAQLELGGKPIAMNHFDYIARDLAASGRYKLVVFGHNHRKEETMLPGRGGRSVTLLNPGPIMGVAFKDGQPERVPTSFARYDTDTGEISWGQVVEE